MSIGFSPVPFTGEEPQTVPFSPARNIRYLRGLCAVLALGALSPLQVTADDTVPESATVVAGKTSWADSVRAALASRAQRLKQGAKWTEQGVASWYGRQFHGRHTSSGEIFNTNALTAAHPTLPIGTKLKVVSEDTGRSVIVTVNDRGPFNNRIIDLSHAAASQLGMLGSGTAHVKIARLEEDGSEETEVADAGDIDTLAPVASAPPRPAQHVSAKHHNASHHH
ncbi:septal ring lytic transglycosylase RlpA family protein [Neokomagataea tanensis]|uniref:Endolytic peptidoglycan transglycosylase RlpA n=1 Tax=Neokomagataea tanensis TaxID=661191 RepID=A0A4Y6V6H5_9PROT|nr:MULTISPECIES: septal ring lytic transglycosylase RlpA family protein [Neokomagataea]QDH24984.1 septal ring lytic transglycosylase RlpA family protein [Neokomagataea tanensis]